MKKVPSGAAEYLARKRRRQIWMKVVICLACVVVFITTYALILPAITLEKPVCGLTEHLHTDECYAETPAEIRKELVCSEQALGIHTHTAGCYGADGSLVCGYADYVVHTHDGDCYNQEGTLVCTLAEVKEHTHTAECYNSDGKLICGKLQGEVHTHTAACYVDGALACGKLEVQAHQHTDTCFRITEQPAEKKLVCGLEEHTHTDTCYPEKAASEKESGKTEDSKAEETETETPEGGTTETKAVNTVQAEDAEEPQAEDAEEPQTEEGEVLRTDSAESVSELAGEVVQAGGKQARAGENEDETDALGEPIVIRPSEINVTYKDEEGNWQPVAGVTLPGDAELQVKISFSNISTDALQANGGRLIYDLPDVLHGVNSQGEIQDSNNTAIGTMVVQDNKVTLVLNDDWLEVQGDYVQGSFYVEGKLNLTEISNHGSSGSVIIGGVEVLVDMEGDWVSRYSSLDVEKDFVNAEGRDEPVVEHTDEGDFLTYVLTATAGPDGIENATVVDKFASTVSVAEYCGVTTAPQPAAAIASVTENITSTASAPAVGTVYYGTISADDSIPDANSAAAKPGSMVWHIGKMEPNEKRTLTYKVKLTDGYSSHRQTATITNTASAYSDTHLRDTATVHFVPEVKFDMRKQHVKSGDLDFAPDSDGIGGTITYIIWITAMEDNNYAVDTKIYDFFATGSNAICNPEYVELIEGSFKLYDGKASSLEETESLAKIGGRLEKDENYNGSYVYYVGSMNPGTTRTLVYQVRIKDEAFLESGEALALRNRARIFAELDNTGVGNGGSALQSWSDDMTILRYNWSEKIAGEALESNTRVSFGENETVYANGQEESGEYLTGFTVPAGSFRYVVKVNEAGNLTVNSALMKDTLGEHLLYSGYMKIEAFEKTGTGAENLYASVNYDTQKPVRTAWMNIDNLSTFSFYPSDLGFGTEDAYAYRITYYAKPDNVGTTEQFVVNNSFYLSGNIGGNYQFVNGGIWVNVAVNVTGSERFSAHKYSWYYERPVEGADKNWERGALYWYIKVSGSTVPENTDLRDHPGNFHVVRDGESLVGIYRGHLPENAADISALEQLTPIPESDYSCTVTPPSEEHNGILDIRFLKEIILDEQEDEAVYIIVKTSPNKLPGETEAVEYTNYLLGEADGETLAELNNTSQTLLGSEGVSKTAKGIFTYDGNEWTKISGDHEVKHIDSAGIEKPGLYLDWLIAVNYFGTLAGEIDLEDVIPEGLELTYLRFYARGNGVTIGDISIPEIDGMEGEKCTWAGRDGGPTCTYYYDSGTNRVRWKVSGLTMQDSQYSDSSSYNQKTVEFQIVCRVTDTDVLLGEQEVYFDNTVVGTQDGQEIGRDSDGMSVKREPASLDKSGVLKTVEGTGKGRIPFSIKVNPLGEDLVPDSDRVILVDELSDSLRIDLTTLHVRGGVEDEPEHQTVLAPSEYTPTLEGNIFSIDLPDGMPLTITYEAVVEAAPGETVNINNSAHWEGYEASTSSEVEEQGFFYTVSAQMESQSARFTLRKVDSANLNYALEGAEFKIGKYSLNREGNSVTLGALLTGTEHSGRTNSNGLLLFEDDGQQAEYLDIEYDTVYGVTETKAPEGYVRETETHYFVIAKETEEGKYLDYPADVHVQYAGVSSEYKYVAQNSKGRIPVDKTFLDDEGNTLDKPAAGSYTFGIYKTASAEIPTGDPLEILTVTYAINGTATYLRDGIPATTMTFKDLDLTGTYAIYELDAEGKPIEEGRQIWLGDTLFEVRYGTNTGITFDQAGVPSSSAAVVNAVAEAYELPESGGPGILMYIFSGTAILAGALYYILRKRREELSL